MPSPVNRDVARFLQAKLPEWLSIDVDIPRGGRAREGLIGIREAAPKLGVPYPSLQKLLRTGGGAGPDFEQAVADLKFGGSIDRLRAAAREWAATQPPTAPTSRLAGDDILRLVKEMVRVEVAAQVTARDPSVIPERIERVFVVARQLGRSDGEALDVARSLAAFTGEITDEEIAARFAPPPKQAKAVGARVVEDDDDFGPGKTPSTRRKR